MSSNIPSWQIWTAHAQPFRRARDLAFCLKVPLDSLPVWASSEGSCETARMRRLTWTFAARIGYKYQIRLTRSNCKKPWSVCGPLGLQCFLKSVCPSTWYITDHENVGQKINYPKFPKYSDTQKICCNHSKIWTWLYHRVMSPNDADGMANCVDPDQTAPLGALWSGSTLFAQTCLSENLGKLRYVCVFLVSQHCQKTL